MTVSTKPPQPIQPMARRSVLRRPSDNTSGINTEIKVDGQKLETVTSFKYLGLVITDEGSKPETLSRIAQTTAALTRFKPVRVNRSISLSSKITTDDVVCFLVTSIFPYTCESWTLTPEVQRRTEAMEMKCCSKILCISYKDHLTNTEVCAKIQQAIRRCGDILTIVPFIRFGQNHLARYSEREKKTRKTEEE